MTAGRTSPGRTATSAGPGGMSGRVRLVVGAALVFMALVAASIVLAAGPAGAHSVVVSSNPAENAVVDQFPERVDIAFNEPPTADFAVLDVIGPDGSSLASGDPSVDGNSITVAVNPPQVAGAYSLVYRVTSADGHPIEGAIGFTVTPAAVTGDPAEQSDGVAAEQTETAGAEQTDAEQNEGGAGGTPLWPVVGIAAVVVAAGALVAVLRQRRVPSNRE